MQFVVSLVCVCVYRFDITNVIRNARDAISNLIEVQLKDGIGRDYCLCAQVG